MRYRVYISASIEPLSDDAQYAPPGSLHFNQTFELSGEKFSDIAPKIDSLVGAIENILMEKA